MDIDFGAVHYSFEIQLLHWSAAWNNAPDLGIHLLLSPPPPPYI